MTAGAGTKGFRKLVLLSIECLPSPHVACKAKVMTKARPPPPALGHGPVISDLLRVFLEHLIRKEYAKAKRSDAGGATKTGAQQCSGDEMLSPLL